MTKSIEPVATSIFASDEYKGGFVKNLVREDDYTKAIS